MTRETITEIADRAFLDALEFMELSCRARGIAISAVTDEEFSFFYDTALVELLPPHTKMSEIFKEAPAGKTIGDLTRELAERKRARGRFVGA